MWQNKKKIINFLFVFIFLVIFSFLPFLVRADNSDASNEPVYYTQGTDLCYTGCVAWKLYWSRNAFWQYIQDYCAMDGGDAAKTLVKFAFNSARGSADFGLFIQSLYCATFMKLYIQPKLEECRTDCTSDIWTYAPDLVGSHSQAISQPSVHYDEDKEKLRIEVHNSGFVYSPKFKVDVYEDETVNQNCEVDDWEKIDSYEIEELAPTNVKRNDLNIPSKNVKEIDWSAPADKCAKIKIVVDPDNRIPELDERTGSALNNEYILTINNLPSPPDYQIREIKHEFIDSSLDDIRLKLKIKNYGEETGRVKITVRDCYGDKTLRGVKNNVQIEAGEEIEESLNLKDLFWPKEPFSYHNSCLFIKVQDDNALAQASHYVQIFSGTVSGRVLDMRGNPVEGATIKVDNRWEAKSDKNGYYHIDGITEQGHFKVFASSSDYDEVAERDVDLFLNNQNTLSDSLRQYNVDFVLFENPASLKINCSVQNYAFRLNGEYFSYQGINGDDDNVLGAIVGGDYQLILHKKGYNTKVFNLHFNRGEQKTINCGLSALEVYDNEDIKFKPTLNNLWDFDLPDGFNIRESIISPDASTIFLAISNMRLGKYKLLVFDRQGKKISESVLAGKKAFDDIHLTSSYDGSRILIDSYLLMDRNGKIIGQYKNENYGLGGIGALSWDGFLICTSHGLYSDSFTPMYTGAWKQELDKPHTKCSFGQFTIFDSSGNTLGQCEKIKDGLCRSSFWSGEQSPLFSLGEKVNYWKMAISPDSQYFLVSISQSAPSDELVYTNRGKIIWRKNIKTANGRVSISPSGNFAVYLEPHGKDFGIHIFDKNGKDLLSERKDLNWKWQNDFYDVCARGEGIFYVRYDGTVHFGVFGKSGKAQKIDLNKNKQEKNCKGDEVKNKKETNQKTIETNKKTRGLLGRLWFAVKSFLVKLFSWNFN